MKEEVKNALHTMHGMGNEAEDSVLYLQTALIYNTTTILSDCMAKVNYIRETEPILTKKITELAKYNPDLEPYTSIPFHFSRIGENIEKLVELIDKKVREGIPFNDRSISEITFLLQRLMDILRSTSDIILARNIFLSKYVRESEAGVIRRAIEYATFHEEMLIEDSPSSVASTIYINILDAIKGVAWHAKAIATKLAG